MADIAIIGGGMAGSLLALVLGRAGRDVIVFDPHREVRPTFRNEKLGHEQMAVLRKLDALSCFEDVCWPLAGHPHAYRDGNPHLTDCGAPHEAWLGAVRAAWPSTVRFVEAMVDGASFSPREQVIEAEDQRFTSRLAVLATGRISTLAGNLGLQRRPISHAHSVCLGFSVHLDRPPAAEVIPAPQGSHVGYVSLFPMPGEFRVNIFSFRGLDDPWTRRMSRDPVTALAEVSPEAAARLAGARVVRRCEARSTDLYEAVDPARDGLVLIGDAFHAPCPASGTGMLRILNDIDLLANTHIPRWLDSDGVARREIARFYADPAKVKLDAASLRKSLSGRETAVNDGFYWRTRRGLARLKRAIGIDEPLTAGAH